MSAPDSDVSDLIQQRTAELRASEERFRTIITENADGILIVNEEGQVCFSNPAACRLFDRDANELQANGIGLPLSHGHACEVQIRRPDGSSRTAELRVVALSWENEPAYLTTLRDVTARKELEEQLRQAQKMEAIALLAGGVAHDFNNLLTVIIGCSQMIRDSAVPGQHHELAAEIMSAAERASNLTRQLLAFSRRQVLRPQVFDLNLLTGDMSRMLTRIVGENISIEVTRAPEPCFIDADPGQIEQVLMNLVVNARDAMPKGGTISIVTRNIASTGQGGVMDPPAARHVVLAVSDTGHGMDEETLGHIFEPFFTTKGISKGTGLGLSTVYGIIKQSGGDIQVCSAPGKGTRFEITLPAVIPAGQPDPAVSDAEVVRGSQTILVVEDELGVRKLICMMLQHLGYTVLEAASGMEGLKLVQEHVGRIDLLIADVIMPGIGGRELADRMQSLRPEVDVLYVSGHVSDVMVENGVARAQVALLEKPFTKNELARKVQEVLHRGPKRSRKANAN